MQKNDDRQRPGLCFGQHRDTACRALGMMRLEPDPVKRVALSGPEQRTKENKGS